MVHGTWFKGDTFTNGDNLATDAACINKRTLVVDKLMKAVEAGTGKDNGVGTSHAPSWRSPEWYNEAFDGISVVVNTTVLTVGFKEPSERQVVLDPKLIPQQTSQSDMYTDSVFSSGYKTKTYTPMYMSEPGRIGTFKRAAIKLSSMDTFFTSGDDWFLIPNQTTQDLH